MPASDEASLLPPEISRYLPGLYMMKFGNKEMSLDMNKTADLLLIGISSFSLF